MVGTANELVTIIQMADGELSVALIMRRSGAVEELLWRHLVV
jgi:hypothetical protein